jgi:gamma-glutamyltranspeptidase/glutathione hydrolase
MLTAFLALEPSAPTGEGPGELHRFVEAARRVQALRRFYVVDPDALTPAENDVLLQRFLRPAQVLEVPIDPDRATPSARVNPLFDRVSKEGEHTTHVSAVDAAGMVVALTTTLSASFGDRVVAPGTGVVLGNAVGSFSAVGDNQPRPGRRTTSSMAPTLVLESGRPVLVLGTPGGDTIPSTLALLVRRLIDRRMPLDQAIDAPRLHHGFVPDEVRYEPQRPLPADVSSALRRLGHKVRSRGAQGDANCVMLEDGRAYGYSDPREAGGLALAAHAPSP